VERVLIMHKQYNLILADPAWKYRDKANAGKRGAEHKYACMTVEQIKALNVPAIAAPNCALFIWTTWPFMGDALQVIKAWGFTYKTCGFLWVKTNPKSGGIATGMGHYTRANTEPCLLAVRGKLKVIAHDVPQVLLAARAEHSVKPKHVHRRIVELYGDLPRIELFARDRFEKWDVWGNEVESDITLEPAPNATANSTHQNIEKGPGWPALETKCSAP
jgi:N6-adenosine-specific RNA methylase IME4